MIMTTSTTKSSDNNKASVKDPEGIEGDEGPSSSPAIDASQQQQEASRIDKRLRAQQLYRGAGLGPMVRCGTLPLRALAFHYGASFCYTEEIVDRSLLECRRVERTLANGLGVVDYEKDGAGMNDRIRKKHDGVPPLLLRIDPALERSRLIFQLGTGDPELALRAAMVVHSDVAAIDVNMGCPKKFSTGSGMGSALLQDPQRACDIVKKLDTHLENRPVSAKIRLLSTSLATIEFASGLIAAGASAVAIHGRRVGDPDTKDADWDTLREVVSVLARKFPSVPVCINGDFYTRNDFTTFMKETSASAVLLARPALYNTSIFAAPPPPANDPSASSALPPTALYGYDSPLLLDKTAVVQDYLRCSATYGAHWKNVKYVVCEMLNLRRTPAGRVPALVAAQKKKQKKAQEREMPTIGQTCACKSLEAMCELWGVSSGEVAPSGSVALSEKQQQPADDDRTYSDAYILRNCAHEDALTAAAANGSAAADGPFAASAGGGGDATAAPAPAEEEGADERAPPTKRARADSP